VLEADSLEVEVLRTHLRAANVSFDQNGNIHLPSWCRSVKIDAGLSFNAKMSFEWLERQPEDLVVFAFEPVQSNINQIQARMQSHPDPEWIYERLILLPLALGNEFCKREFFVTHDTGQSSLLRPTKAEIELVEMVEVVTLQAFNSLISLQDMPYIDHLKTDCQGTDLDILRGAGPSIARYACITSESETANYEGSQNSLRHTRDYLSGFGFTQINSRNAIRILVGDFIKRFDGLHTIVRAFYGKNVGQKEIVRPGLTIEVEDPTYINPDVLVNISDRTISVFQRG
jgi:FkbM family methyltransferase